MAVTVTGEPRVGVRELAVASWIAWQRCRWPGCPAFCCPLSAVRGPPEAPGRWLRACSVLPFVPPCRRSRWRSPSGWGRTGRPSGRAAVVVTGSLLALTLPHRRDEVA
jgi:hypothetical protein